MKFPTRSYTPVQSVARLLVHLFIRDELGRDRGSGASRTPIPGRSGEVCPDINEVVLEVRLLQPSWRMARLES